MDFEIDFLPVGDASRAGDAIAVRYVDGDVYRIIVIDGGTDDAGQALVEHIEAYYGAGVIIDHVVSTHPDTDHACGLRAILDNFEVRNLWVHPLWQYAGEMLPYFNDKRWTAPGLEQAIRDSYPVIDELIGLAEDQNTAIREPFEGAQIGPFTVLSPSRYAYLRLVPQFRKTPAADEHALAAENMLMAAAGRRKGAFANVVEAVRNWIAETWLAEQLREGAVTAAENETSTVLYGDFGDETVLLTGDAGVEGLTWAADRAATIGMPLPPTMMIQVPHHGSRSNVTPSILNVIVGPPVAIGATIELQAAVSCPKDDANHPRKMVLNAFRRRGVRVFKTNGNSLHFHHGNMPSRGWNAAVEYPWFDAVEEYD